MEHYESYTPTTRANKLTSLSTWSADHIRDVFEADSDTESLRAIEATFSPNIKVTLNGSPMPGRESIKHLVLSMRRASTTGLTVHWQRASEKVMDTKTNREGTFDGFYVIRGIRKQLPGMNKPVEFERHKNVSVKIESESLDPHVDSRRIVRLDFIATDVRVERQAAL